MRLIDIQFGYVESFHHIELTIDWLQMYGDMLLMLLRCIPYHLNDFGVTLVSRAPIHHPHLIQMLHVEQLHRIFIGGYCVDHNHLRHRYHQYTIQIRLCGINEMTFDIDSTAPRAHTLRYGAVVIDIFGCFDATNELVCTRYQVIAVNLMMQMACGRLVDGDSVVMEYEELLLFS